MTDAVAIALVGAVSTVLTTAISAFFSVRSARISKSTNETVLETKELVRQTEVNTNSLTQQLVARTAIASKAEGKLEEQKEQAQRENV